MNMRVRTPLPVQTDDEEAQAPRRIPQVLLVVLLTLAAGATAWWWLSRGASITAVRVSRGDAAEIVYATGAVEPETWSRSSPLVRGRIVERCRCEGKQVKAGDLLARLDDKEALATLNDLRALEGFQQREFERQSQLLSRGATTAQTYQRAESDLARIHAQVAAQAQRLDYYRLVAPMDGVVLREDGEVGDMVDPGTILYRIGLEKPLWVVADVNEEDIPRVSLGQKVWLRADAYGGRTLQGAVKQITPAGDPISKTFRVRIGIPDNSPLRVGMSVEANIVVRERLGAILVPANAITGGHVLAIEGGRARARKVEIGIRGSGFVEVITGVNEGEIVAAPATTNIRDGARVRPRLPETSQP